MTRLTTREAYVPLAVVTLLFLLWGFAYGLLNSLNNEFEDIVNLNNGQKYALHASYFAGYLVAPPTMGRYIFKHAGFKASFISGLWLYSIGTLIFWPSAVFESYPAFVVSNFIVGLGVATLELSANPFIAMCGPPCHAEIRLNVSNGVQAIGAVVAPILAQKAMFENVENDTGLMNAQWAYLAIALFSILLSVFFIYMPLPEATDEDFAEMSLQSTTVSHARILDKVPVLWLTLGLGVFSTFMFVGTQEAVVLPYQAYVAEQQAV